MRNLPQAYVSGTVSKGLSKLEVVSAGRPQPLITQGPLSYAPLYICVSCTVVVRCCWPVYSALLLQSTHNRVDSYYYSCKEHQQQASSLLMTQDEQQSQNTSNYYSCLERERQPRHTQLITCSCCLLLRDTNHLG